MADLGEGVGDDVDRVEAGLAERQAAERESVRVARLATSRRVLGAAELRDVEAEARDRVAVERDHVADMKAFTSPDGDSGYGADLPARRHAAMDRDDAKGDRISAANDRATLTGGSDGSEVPEDGSEVPEDLGPDVNGTREEQD